MLHVYVEIVELDGETLVQPLLFFKRKIPNHSLGKRKENWNRNNKGCANFFSCVFGNLCSCVVCQTRLIEMVNTDRRHLLDFGLILRHLDSLVFKKS